MDMAERTTMFQAQDAFGAFERMCQDHGAICQDAIVGASELPGLDASASWEIHSESSAGSLFLGVGVVGLRSGKVVSASFEPTGRAANAAFVGGAADLSRTGAADAANALALAFKLWPRDMALAEQDARARLAQKLEGRRDRKVEGASFKGPAR
jgi:hypothetical protein